MPLMLLFQVHDSFLPVFLVWFVWSEPIYYSIYLEIFVGTRTYKCCVALPVLNVRFLCVGLFVSLCCSCAFRPLLSTCQTVEGRHAVSHLLCCGFLSFGGQVSAVNLPPRPPLRVVCLVERVTMRNVVSDRLWRDLTYSTIPLLCVFLSPVCCNLVRFCVNQMSVWAKITIPVFTLNLALIALPPPLTPRPSSQPLRVDVAVLPTSSRGQDPTFSSVWLTSSCSI